MLRTHNGFGDVIYVRPVVAEYVRRHREPVYLATAWPEMFADLPVRFVRAKSGLDWSNRHMAAQSPETWSGRSPQMRELDLRIDKLRPRFRKESMPDLMAKQAGVPVSAFDLPELPQSPITAERIAVIRPVTVRSDWPHRARNPLPEYMQQAAVMLRDAGFLVVSVAGISEAEPYLGEPPFAHQRFDHSELGPLELLALVKKADVVVTGPGWAVPAALATGTPLVVIAGGAGGTNGPQALVPKWYQGDVTWIKPADFCQCQLRNHGCPKAIPDFPQQFANAMNVTTHA